MQKRVCVEIRGVSSEADKTQRKLRALLVGQRTRRSKVGHARQIYRRCQGNTSLQLQIISVVEFNSFAAHTACPPCE